MNTKEIGDFGEEKTCEYLIKKGYKILERNFRCKNGDKINGEIDIIAENDDNIVFVEVKTRKSMSYAMPSQYVDLKKQSKIKMTAQMYCMLYNKLSDKMFRFDVSEIIYSQSNNKLQIHSVNYIEDAF